MKVLGIDPGTSRIGYGIIEKKGNHYQAVSYGLIEPPSHFSPSLKLKAIYEEITRLIELHQPDLFSIEELFYFKNAKTVISVAQARGVILLAAENQKTPVFECTPLQVKQGITGYGRADKNQIAAMVKMLLKLEKIPKPDDITDGLAIAITGSNYYPYEKIIGKSF